VVPSQRCVPISQTKFPKLLASEWIAPNCTIIGDVTTGKYSSFYHGVTLRGDTCKITIGSKTVIQDNTIIMNSDFENKSAEIFIGDKVLIGVNCNIDSCRIDDGAVISDGATVHKGCHIQAGAMVAAGAVIPPNTIVPSGQIFAGNPGKYLRDLKPEELISISENLTEKRELANVMVEHTEMTHYEFLSSFRNKLEQETMTNEEKVIRKLETFGYWTDASTQDDFGVEGSNAIEGLDEWENENNWRFTVGDVQKDNYDLHYEQDMTNYPDSLKVYSENYSRGDALRKKFENEIPGESPEWPNQYVPPQRPGAMRAWLSKWDPDYNTEFKQVGNQTENRNG
jgi:carbonic anhydrase/acetyltransferase-like protein (isoleucine patch superfamily)